MSEIDKAIKRLERLYRDQETLRIKHNERGTKFQEDGDKDKWLKYKINVFKPKSRELARELATIRSALLNANIYTLQSLSTLEIIYPDEAKSDGNKLHYLLLLRKELNNSESINPVLLDNVTATLYELKQKLKAGKRAR